MRSLGRLRSTEKPLCSSIQILLHAISKITAVTYIRRKDRDEEGEEKEENEKEEE